MAKLMPLGSYIAFLTVLFAATSALNATIFSAARVSYALGRDRMLPGVLGRISAKRSTPHVALAASSVLVAAGIFLPITDLASAASIMFLFLFLLANVCVLRMRWNLGEEMQYGFLMPLFPLIPLAAIVLQLVLAIFIVNVSWLAWVIGPGWIAAGLAIYFLYARTRALPIREEIFAVDAPVVPSDGKVPDPRAGRGRRPGPAAGAVDAPARRGVGRGRGARSPRRGARPGPALRRPSVRALRAPRAPWRRACTCRPGAS